MKATKRMGYLESIAKLKCPRCRQGDLFKVKNPYRFKHLFDMYDYCPVCGQKTELEIGFWYGTGYISYGLAVAFSAFNLVWYWLIFGITWRDNSIYWWLIINGTILFITMPWLIRLSRIIYLSIFVHYDPDAALHPEHTPENGKEISPSV
jgi:hypothetical protein